jgi:hypothetical protein
MRSSDKIVIESPMSFAGSRKRILNWSDNTWVRWLLLSWVIAVAWMFVGIWYMGFAWWLGWLIFPFRIIRRGQRRDKLAKAQHQEMMDALKK